MATLNRYPPSETSFSRQIVKYRKGILGVAAAGALAGVALYFLPPLRPDRDLKVTGKWSEGKCVVSPLGNDALNRYDLGDEIRKACRKGNSSHSG